MPRNPDWTRDELLAALDLYCRTPFGKQDSRNPEVIALAHAIGRTPGAVSYKLNNFASVDPNELARGVRGASHDSKAGRELFLRFLAHPDEVAVEMEEALLRLGVARADTGTNAWSVPSGPTEREAVVRMRLLQGFFRRTVMAAYNWRCAMCDVDVPDLLNAAHIIPWSKAEGRRADPRNGLALCVLHDRAFDRGIVTVSANYRVVVVHSRLAASQSTQLRRCICDLDGQPITTPKSFVADPQALSLHRAWATGATGSACDRLTEVQTL